MNREMLKNFIIELGKDTKVKNRLMQHFAEELNQKENIKEIIKDLKKHKKYLFDFIKSFEVDEKKVKNLLMI